MGGRHEAAHRGALSAGGTADSPSRRCGGLSRVRNVAPAIPVCTTRHLALARRGDASTNRELPVTTSDAKRRPTGAFVEGEPAVVTAGRALRDTLIAVAISPSPPGVLTGVSDTPPIRTPRARLSRVILTAPR
jgi:hypothetical protein